MKPAFTTCRIAVLTALLSPHLLAAQDVSGAWEVTMEVPGAEESRPRFVLTQDSYAITGTWEHPVLGSLPIEGSIEGEDIQLWVTLPLVKGANSQRQLTQRFSGVIRDDEMSGTVWNSLDGGPVLEGYPWSARRRPPVRGP